MNLLIFSLIISLLFGLDPILGKSMLAKTDIKLFFAIVNLTLVVSLLLYTYYYWNDLKQSIFKTSTKEFISITVFALVVLILPNLLYYNLLKHHNSHAVSALTSCGPVFTVIIAILFYKEPLDTIDIFAIFMITIGIIILTYNN